MDNVNQPVAGGSKTGMWVALVIALAVLGVGAYFLFARENGTNKNNGNSTVNSDINAISNVNSFVNANVAVNENANAGSNINAATNSSAEVDTSGWKTYQDESFGYSFEYPESWQYMTFENIDQRTSKATVFGTGAISNLGDSDTVLTDQIQTLQLTNGLTAAGLAQEFEITVISSKALEINGHKGLSYEATAGGNPTSGIVVLLDDTQKSVVHIVVTESLADTTIQSVFNSLQISN